MCIFLTDIPAECLDPVARYPQPAASREWNTCPSVGMSRATPCLALDRALIEIVRLTEVYEVT